MKTTPKQKITEISSNGMKLVKESEGIRLQAYKDAVGVWTIGYGTTRINGKPIRSGQRISLEEAERLLKIGVQEHLHGALKYINPEINLNQNQVDVVADFVYNLGVGAFASSTFLRLINQNRLAEAALQLPRWNKGKVNGKLVELRGLTIRRAKEVALWNS